MAHERNEPPIVLGSLTPARFPAERYESGPTFDLGKGDLVTPPLAGQELGEPSAYTIIPLKGKR